MEKMNVPMAIEPSIIKFFSMIVTAALFLSLCVSPGTCQYDSSYVSPGGSQYYSQSYSSGDPYGQVSMPGNTYSQLPAGYPETVSLPGMESIVGIIDGENRVSYGINVLSKEQNYIPFNVKSFCVYNDQSDKAILHSLNTPLKGVIDVEKNTMMIDFSSFEDSLGSVDVIDKKDMNSMLMKNTDDMILNTVMSLDSVEQDKVNFKISEMSVLEPDGVLDDFMLETPVTAVYDAGNDVLSTVAFNELVNVFQQNFVSVQQNTFISVVNQINVLNQINVISPILSPPYIGPFPFYGGYGGYGGYGYGQPYGGSCYGGYGSPYYGGYGAPCYGDYGGYGSPGYGGCGAPCYGDYGGPGYGGSCYEPSGYRGYDAPYYGSGYGQNYDKQRGKSFYDKRDGQPGRKGYSEPISTPAGCSDPVSPSSCSSPSIAGKPAPYTSDIVNKPAVSALDDKPGTQGKFKGQGPKQTSGTVTRKSQPEKSTSLATTPNSAPVQKKGNDIKGPGTVSGPAYTKGAAKKDGKDSPFTRVSAPSAPSSGPGIVSSKPADNTPKSKSSAPAKTVTAPKSKSSAPTKTVTAPKSKTSAPTKTVTAPKSKTSAPTKTVTAPKSKTSAPTKTVTAPKSQSGSTYKPGDMGKFKGGKSGGKSNAAPRQQNIVSKPSSGNNNLKQSGQAKSNAMPGGQNSPKIASTKAPSQQGRTSMPAVNKGSQRTQTAPVKKSSPQTYKTPSVSKPSSYQKPQNPINKAPARQSPQYTGSSKKSAPAIKSQPSSNYRPASKSTARQVTRGTKSAPARSTKSSGAVRSSGGRRR
ncbi:hypothetical protein [Methanooceanicella nereidis]|uniref:hypothetical protein n=1 Tax=Methanooceanicella nereidis TaxID=2052831 RepID=UPI001E3BAAA1|nr:hypothetical protein [Methanocella sp. CWC-04]